MYLKVKRIIDIVFSLVGLAITSPILLITAIAIKLDSPGPVIFKQERLGVGGKIFKIYKLRSMCLDAEKDGIYEKKGDTRVTRVGNIIRKTSIDEIPQFINILKGEMSLIGPRPALTYHPWFYKDYTDEQKKMFNVRPGVTGWAQINGRKAVDWPRRIELNVDYVENITFLLDVKIFFITMLKVLRMEDNLNLKETVVENRKDS